MLVFIFVLVVDLEELQLGDFDQDFIWFVEVFVVQGCCVDQVFFEEIDWLGWFCCGFEKICQGFVISFLENFGDDLFMLEVFDDFEIFLLRVDVGVQVIDQVLDVL